MNLSVYYFQVLLPMQINKVKLGFYLDQLLCLWQCKKIFIANIDQNTQLKEGNEVYFANELLFAIHL